MTGEEMNLSDLGASKAHVQLIGQLCDAIKELVATVEPHTQRRVVSDRPSPNDNDEVCSTREVWADVIGLRGIMAEFGLKASQVTKLRERWGFPSPITSGRRLLFSRSEIERWARAQPNRQNLAIVLRIRSRQR